MRPSRRVGRALLAVALAVLGAGCGARSSLLDLDGAAPATLAATTSTTTTSSTTTAGGGAGGGPVVRCGFAERFGDAHEQHVTSFAVDPTGAIVLGGLVLGRLELGGVALDAGRDTSTGRGPAVVAKLDAAGHALWGKVLGAPSDAASVSVAVDAQGDVVVALISDTPVDFGLGAVEPTGRAAMVAKLAPDGHALWSRVVTPPGPERLDFELLSIGAGAAGDVAVLARATGDLPYLIVAKLDAAGADAWSRRAVTYGGGPLAFADRLALDAEGGVTLAMTQVTRLGESSSVDLGGGPIEVHGPGGLVIAKLDAAGSFVHGRGLDRRAGLGLPIGADGHYQFHILPVQLAAMPDGGAVVASTFFGAVDLGLGPLAAATSGSLLVARFDAAGETRWAEGFGDGAMTTGLARAGGGRLFVAGPLVGSIDLGGGPLVDAGDGPDLFVATLDADTGHPSATERYVGVSDAAADARYYLDVDAAGVPVVAGDLIGSLALCGGTLTSAGSSDVVVARLEP